VAHAVGSKPIFAVAQFNHSAQYAMVLKVLEIKHDRTK